MHFGIIDIIASLMNDDDCIDEMLENWINRKEFLKRHFTVVTTEHTHLLTLSISNLDKMKFDFYNTYETVFRDGLKRLK